MGLFGSAPIFVQVQSREGQCQAAQLRRGVRIWRQRLPLSFLPVGRILYGLHLIPPTPCLPLHQEYLPPAGDMVVPFVPPLNAEAHRQLGHSPHPWYCKHDLQHAYDIQSWRYTHINGDGGYLQ